MRRSTSYTQVALSAPLARSGARYCLDAASYGPSSFFDNLPNGPHNRHDNPCQQIAARDEFVAQGYGLTHQSMAQTPRGDGPPDRGGDESEHQQSEREQGVVFTGLRGCDFAARDRVHE